MERHILKVLSLHEECTTDYLAGLYEPGSPDTSRAVRSSLNRALRSLKAKGEIERNTGGNSFGWSLSDWDRRQTAHHEAGHAVIAAVLRIPFRYATIVNHKQTAGHVQFKAGYISYKGWQWTNVPSSVLSKLRNNVISTLAGRIAEDRFIKLVHGRDARLPYSPFDDSQWRKDISRYGASSDRKQIRDGLARIIGAPPEWLSAEDTKDEKARLTKRAADLVKKHWAAIERVAHALLEEETLKASEIVKLMKTRA